MKEEAMSDNTLMNLTRRMRGETTTTCDQCGKSYVGPNGTPLFVGLRDTGIGEDMLQAFCSWECAASWFVTRAGGQLVCYPLFPSLSCFCNSPGTALASTCRWSCIRGV